MFSTQTRLGRIFHKRNNAKSRRRLREKISELDKILSKHAPSTENSASESPSSVPISMAREAVLPSRVRVNVKMLAAFNRMFKGQQRLLNTILSTEDDSFDRIGKLLLIKAEDSLKVSGQLAGIFPREIPPGTQIILEEFYTKHGVPNPAESEFLARHIQADTDSLNAWFAAKETLLGPTQALEQSMLIQNIRSLSRKSLFKTWRRNKT